MAFRPFEGGFIDRPDLVYSMVWRVLESRANWLGIEALVGEHKGNYGRCVGSLCFLFFSAHV